MSLAVQINRNNGIPLHGFSRNGLRAPGPCPINCTNNNEAFSFHPGGCHALFSDGHVRFLSDSIDFGVLRSAVSADQGEVVGEF